MMPEDYYIVLGISRSADIDKIKKTCRRVAKKYHPDVAHSKEGAEKFQEIREAYETLVDQKRHRRYDQELAQRGSEIRISRVPEIIERRRSPLDDMERFFSRTDEFLKGFLPGFFDIGMRDAYLHVRVLIDPYLEEEEW